MNAIATLKDEFIKLCKQELDPNIDYSVVKISRTNPDFQNTGDYSFNFNAIKRHFNLSAIELGEKLINITSLALASVDDDNDRWVYTETV